MMRRFLEPLLIVFIVSTFILGGCAPKQVPIQVPEQTMAKHDEILPGKEEHVGEIVPESPVYHKEPFSPGIPDSGPQVTEGKYDLGAGELKGEVEILSPGQEFVEDSEQIGMATEQQKELHVFMQGTALPDINKVEGRIQVYQERLSLWTSLEENMVSLDINDELLAQLQECKLYVAQILSDYMVLRENMMAGHGEKRVLPAPWEFFSRDIEYLESACDAVYTRCADNVTNWLNQFNTMSAEQREMVISDFAEAKNYYDIPAIYEQLTKSFPEWKPSLKTRIDYAKALVQIGKINESVDILKMVAADLKTEKVDIHAVNRTLADILFATGNIEEAKASYQELSDYYSSSGKAERWVADQLALLANADPYANDMHAFLTVLRNYIVFDGMNMPQELPKVVAYLENTFPNSIFTQRANQIFKMVEEQINTWAIGQINLATDLAEAKDFQKAIQMLEQLLGQKIPRELHNEARKNLMLVRESAEFEKENQLLILEQSLALQYDEAVTLFDSQRYDDAIAAYTALLGTKYNDEALESIAQAAALAASDMRRQAAGLFVKARKTDDLEQKRYLLQESRRLLQEILEKYPNVEIINKVQQNLAILEENIQNLFPELLEESENERQGVDTEREKTVYDFAY